MYPNVDEIRLLKFFLYRDFSQSGIGIIIHVTEHYSYHTGQISFSGQSNYQGKDLGFYAKYDLNKKNIN
jgi:hypothetical protein